MDACAVCAEAGRKPPRPQVSLPRAFKKGEMLALDNFYLQGMKGVGLLMVGCGSFKARTAWQANRNPEAVLEQIVFNWALEDRSPQYPLMDAAKGLQPHRRDVRAAENRRPESLQGSQGVQQCHPLRGEGTNGNERQGM